MLGNPRLAVSDCGIVVWNSERHGHVGGLERASVRQSDAPDEISSIAFFWTIPRSDPFPPELRGARVFLYGALYAGPAEEGESVLAPLMKIGTPILDLSGRGPYTQWQRAFDPFFLPGAVTLSCTPIGSRYT
jgi:hypothetical protein